MDGRHARSIMARRDRAYNILLYGFITLCTSPLSCSAVTSNPKGKGAMKWQFSEISENLKKWLHVQLLHATRCTQKLHATIARETTTQGV